MNRSVELGRAGGSPIYLVQSPRRKTSKKDRLIMAHNSWLTDVYVPTVLSNVVPRKKQNNRRRQRGESEEGRNFGMSARRAAFSYV